MNSDQFLYERLGTNPVIPEKVSGLKDEAIRQMRRDARQVALPLVVAAVLFLVAVLATQKMGALILPAIIIGGAVVFYFSALNSDISRFDSAATKVPVRSAPSGLLEDYESDPNVRATVKALASKQDGELYRF
jgi:hypothetical protein